MRPADLIHGLSLGWAFGTLLPLSCWQLAHAQKRQPAPSDLLRRDVAEPTSLADVGVRVLGRIDESSTSKTLHPDGETIFGVEPWKFAVAVCLFSSVFVVCGFMLQKMGAESSGSYRTVGFIVLSPTWLAGFSLILVATAVGDYWSFSLAPLSMIAPLSGVTVVLNVVLAPVFLGEKLQPWPDLPASLLIFLGFILSTSAGAHKEMSYSYDQLMHLALRPVTIGSYVLLLAISFCCALYAHHQSNELEKMARARPYNPKLPDVLLPAITAATAGSLANVHLKAEAELIKSGASSFHCFIGLVFVLAFGAVQLNFVNRGLQLYMQTIFLPVYSSLLVLGCTVYGGVFYQEYEELLAHGIGTFMAGVVLILTGIGLFTKRQPSEQLSSQYGSI